VKNQGTNGPAPEEDVSEQLNYVPDGPQDPGFPQYDYSNDATEGAPTSTEPVDNGASQAAPVGVGPVAGHPFQHQTFSADATFSAPEPIVPDSTATAAVASPDPSGSATVDTNLPPADGSADATGTTGVSDTTAPADVPAEDSATGDMEGSYRGTTIPQRSAPSDIRYVATQPGAAIPNVIRGAVDPTAFPFQPTGAVQVQPNGGQ
jgi:hypothetical protein